MKFTKFHCHNPVYLYKYGRKTILGNQLSDNYDGTYTIRNPVEIISVFGRLYLKSLSLYNTITIVKLGRKDISDQLKNVYSRFILLEYIILDLPKKDFIYLMKFNYFSRLMFPFIPLANLMSGEQKKSVQREIVTFSSTGL
jgi:hypothetical protein